VAEIKQENIKGTCDYSERPYRKIWVKDRKGQVAFVYAVKLQKMFTIDH
jgi:hypothetical protein